MTPAQERAALWILHTQQALETLFECPFVVTLGPENSQGIVGSLTLVTFEPHMDVHPSVLVEWRWSELRSRGKEARIRSTTPVIVAPDGTRFESHFIDREDPVTHIVTYTIHFRVPKTFVPLFKRVSHWDLLLESEEPGGET